MQYPDAAGSGKRHRDLHETLSRYVHEGKSVTRTAQALNIHPNTLYQRLQRIQRLTGRKITDGADFTLLSLACQLHAEYTGAGKKLELELQRLKLVADRLASGGAPSTLQPA